MCVVPFPVSVPYRYHLLTDYQYKAHSITLFMHTNTWKHTDDFEDELPFAVKSEIVQFGKRNCLRLYILYNIHTLRTQQKLEAWKRTTMNHIWIVYVLICTLY